MPWPSCPGRTRGGWEPLGEAANRTTCSSNMAAKSRGAASAEGMPVCRPRGGAAPSHDQQAFSPPNALVTREGQGVSRAQNAWALRAEAGAMAVYSEGPDDAPEGQLRPAAPPGLHMDTETRSHQMDMPEESQGSAGTAQRPAGPGLLLVSASVVGGTLPAPRMATMLQRGELCTAEPC